MGSVKTWSTKEEVLKDLARASGRRIKKKDDLDEGYIVIGDGPPPVIVEDEDDEMQLLFGEEVSRKGLATTDDLTPDLLGIQQMLQMVHEYDGGDNDDDIKTNSASKTSDGVVITKVSQLNPYVKEFTPKSTTLLSSQNTVDSNNSINENIVTQAEEVLSKNNTDVNCNEIVKVENNMNESEYQDIATKLKNEISDAAKSDSFEFKKQKNVAIATLLRLYASNNKSPKKSTEPLKLITPEYFEGKKDDNLDINIENVTTVPQSESSTPEPIPTCSSNSISSTPLQTLSENNLHEKNTKTTPKKKIDPEIKLSIEKVNKWLEEPVKSKSPAVCLGPVAFKRKEPKESKSSKSTISYSEQKASKSSGEGQRYQPSNYAADLGRKYMERNKITEDQKQAVTWSNLDQKLKEKDLLIKKQLEEQASASDSNDESVVPHR